MTPILSLHNVEVTKFLDVLDTCEAMYISLQAKATDSIFAASFASLSVLQDLSKAARLQKQVLFAKTKMTSASFSDLICSATQVMPKQVNSENTDLNIYGFHVNFKTSKPKDSCEQSQLFLAFTF